MGLYEEKKDLLEKHFSFSQFCEAFYFSEESTKDARNLLKSFAKRGFIKRVSRNNYMKLVE